MTTRMRPLVLLALVAVVLIVGIAVQRYGGGSGDASPSVPDSELTPAPSSSSILPGPGSTRTTAGETATSAPPKATQAPAGRDLQADEAQGGHTIARHVGRTDEQLRQRLRDEPDISAASTYTDLATAERVVAEVLTSKAADVRKWEQRSGSRANLALRMDVGEVIGRSIAQGKSRAEECEDAVVVLRWTGDSWFVLTSYPEDR